MVSKRARATNSLGTRLSAIQEGVAAIEAKTRTPADDGVAGRLAAIEHTLERLSSVNYRLEEQAAAEDTGWVSIATNIGFAPEDTNLPQVRKIGKVVYARGGWDNTGIAVSTTYAAIGVIPEDFRPAETVLFAPGMSSGAAQATMRIEPNGNVALRTGPVGSSYYTTNGTWLVD